MRLEVETHRISEADGSRRKCPRSSERRRSVRVYFSPSDVRPPPPSESWIRAWVIWYQTWTCLQMILLVLYLVAVAYERQAIAKAYRWESGHEPNKPRFHLRPEWPRLRNEVTRKMCISPLCINSSLQLHPLATTRWGYITSAAGRQYGGRPLWSVCFLETLLKF